MLTQMFAVKNTADDGRYSSVTRNLIGGKIVRCPVCNEPYVVYAKTQGLASRGCALLLQYLGQECPHHAEFIAADEAA